jgi:hypothetical protein
VKKRVFLFGYSADMRFQVTRSHADIEIDPDRNLQRFQKSVSKFYAPESSRRVDLNSCESELADFHFFQSVVPQVLLLERFRVLYAKFRILFKSSGFSALSSFLRDS